MVQRGKRINQNGRLTADQSSTPPNQPRLKFLRTRSVLNVCLIAGKGGISVVPQSA